MAVAPASAAPAAAPPQAALPVAMGGTAVPAAAPASRAMAEAGMRPAGRAGQTASGGALQGTAANGPASASRQATRHPADPATAPGTTPSAEPGNGDGLAPAASTAAAANGATAAAAEPPAPSPSTQPMLAGTGPAALPDPPAADAAGGRAGDPMGQAGPTVVRPASGQGAAAESAQPGMAAWAERTRQATPGDAPVADPARPAPESVSTAAAGVQPVAPQPGAAGPQGTAAERAMQALGVAAQAVARAEPQAQTDPAASVQVLPPTMVATSGPVQMGGSTAGTAPMAEARVPVPLDNPGFGAALGTQVSVLVRDGVQTARLQLNPAEMGPIAVQIALDGSAARVDFQADLAGTRAVIEASLPALAGALQEAGFTLAGGGVFQQTPGRQGQGDAPAQPGQPRGNDGNTRVADLPTTAVPLRTQRGLVDLVA